MGARQQFPMFGRQSRSRLLRALHKSIYIVAILACFLPQAVLAVTSTVAGGVLTITTDNIGETVTVTCDAIPGGNVKVNGVDPTGGPAPCIDISDIAVTGGTGSDTIDLSAVNTPAFTSTITVTVDSGAGTDVITGTFFADTLSGGADNDRVVGHRGADNMNGDGGDDTLVWNNGDGSDVASGGSGSDTMVVNGGNLSETFTISGTTTGVLFNRLTQVPFSINIISPTEQLILNGNDGAETITGTTGLNGVITITVNGGNGNDLIRGGDGPDTLNGDGDNDTLIGFRGADTMSGGPGDDTLVWNNGDGSDIASGGSGNDTMVVNGGNLSETFTISGTTTGVLFNRLTQVPFSINIISPTEQLILNGNDGAETVTGTTGLNGVITITVNGGNGDDLVRGGDGPDTLNGDNGNDTLIGFRGADAMNGGPGNDTMIWNNGDGSDVASGGSGDDTMVVNGGNLSETFTISGTTTGVLFNRLTQVLFSINIISPTEKLVLNGNAGAEVVTGTTGLNRVITITVNGGDGDDLIKGGDGPDTLNGDNGNDTLIGFRGADTKNGGPGNDTMIWNNGDGSDIMAGGDGDDLVVVNGAAVSETFAITPSGQVAVAGPQATAVGSVLFRRVTPGPFSLDIEAEGVQVNGFDGDDTFNVTPLPNTDVHFNGGGQTLADILRVDAQSRTVDVLPGQVVVPGTQPVTFQNVEIVEVINSDDQLLLPLIRTWKGPNP